MIYCDNYYSLIYCLKSFVIYYLSFVVFYCLSNSCFDFLSNFWTGRLTNIYFESLSENDFYYNLGFYFCLNLILNNCFDIGCFDYLI